MFIVIKLDTYNSCGCATPEDVYGPFATREEAEAFEKRVSSIKLIGQDYRVKPIELPQKLVDWLNQFARGTVPN